MADFFIIDFLGPDGEPLTVLSDDLKDTPVTVVFVFDEDVTLTTLDVGLNEGALISQSGSSEVTASGVVWGSGMAFSEFLDSLIQTGKTIGEGATPLMAARIDVSVFSVVESPEPVSQASSDDNAAPGLALASYGIAENTTEVAQIAASDPDGDTLIFSIVDENDGALFEIDDTGYLVFTTAPDFEAPMDGDADNVYEVTVAVSDGALEATQTYQVHVDDVAEGLGGRDVFLFV